VVAIADGLGHGPMARQAAVRFIEFVAARPLGSLPSALEGASRDLRSTRGAAAALLRLSDARAEFAGIGNIAFAAHSRQRVLATSVPGIVGRAGRHARPFPFELASGDMVVLYTDGVRSGFDAAEFAVHPVLSQAADDLIARYGKDSDDATCVLARRVG
jgi:hypothetical protein